MGLCGSGRVGSGGLMYGEVLEWVWNGVMVSDVWGSTGMELFLEGVWKGGGLMYGEVLEGGSLWRESGRGRFLCMGRYCNVGVRRDCLMYWGKQ